MTITFPGESAEYREARDRLLAREVELRRAMEAVAEARPLLHVFRRDDSAIRHFWSSELFFAPAEPGQDPRHVGTLEPVWNVLDLRPDGRPGADDEQLSYQ